MDKSQAVSIAKEYLNLIKTKFDVKKAYIFGSFAKGSQHEDSDIDIAIILKKKTDIIESQIELMKLRRKINLNIEPHPFYFKDFNVSNPLAYEILKYGEILV
jgi:predicted nucleotidyltransferase